jgi:hypothetical protein
LLLWGLMIGDYLLNHNKENPNPLLECDPALEYNDGKPIYRIFEKQWKEVYLFWLGRKNIDNEQKIALFELLQSFEDNCDNNYWFQGFFLRAEGIVEFKEYSYEKRQEIVYSLLCMAFGYLLDSENSNSDFSDSEDNNNQYIDPNRRNPNNDWKTWHFYIQDKARLTLVKTDGNIAVEFIPEIFLCLLQRNLVTSKAYPDKNSQIDFEGDQLGLILYMLEKFGKNNELVIEQLFSILENLEQKYNNIVDNSYKFFKVIIKISTQISDNFLAKFEPHHDLKTLYENYQKTGKYNLLQDFILDAKRIHFLLYKFSLLTQYRKNYSNQWYQSQLEYLSIHLLELISLFQCEKNYPKLEQALTVINHYLLSSNNPKSETIMNTLVNLAKTIKNKDIICKIIDIFNKNSIEQQLNPIVINFLINMLETTKESKSYM